MVTKAMSATTLMRYHLSLHFAMYWLNFIFLMQILAVQERFGLFKDKWKMPSGVVHQVCKLSGRFYWDPHVL